MLRPDSASVLAEVCSPSGTPAEGLPYMLVVERIVDEYSRRVRKLHTPQQIWGRPRKLRKNRALPRVRGC
jgi:hypothetical protein